MAKKTIFIIEDDPDISELMQMIVESEGFVVRTFSEMEKIESVIAKQKPQLVIMDLSVGGVDSAAIARKLKYEKQTSGTRVLLVSAKTSLAEIARAARVDGYLAKPFDIKDLIGNIKKLT